MKSPTIPIGTTIKHNNMKEQYKPEIRMLKAITIEEFCNIREAIRAIKTSQEITAFQARAFFSNKENEELVLAKLEALLIYKAPDDSSRNWLQ